MRRASTCLALLGLAVLSLTGVASAAPDRHAQRQSRADPRLPGHRQHPRRGRRGRSEIHDQRHRIDRRRALADHARQLLPARGREDQPDRLRDLPAGDARKHRSRAAARRSRRPAPSARAGVVDPIGGELVKENATLQAFFAPGGGLQFYANAASPISAQLLVAQGHFIKARRALRHGAQHRSAAGPVGPRRPAGVDRIDQRSRSAPRTRRARRRSPTARCRRSARKAASR